MKTKPDPGRWYYSGRGSSRGLVLYRRERGLCHCWPSLLQMAPHYWLPAEAAPDSPSQQLCIAPPSPERSYHNTGAQPTSRQLSENISGCTGWKPLSLDHPGRPKLPSEGKANSLLHTPPVNKTHSSWSAMVCSRSPCHHCLTLSSAMCPLGQPETSRAAAPTGLPAILPWRCETPDKLQVPPRKGVLLQLSSCKPCRVGQNCCLVQRGAGDQPSNGIQHNGLSSFSKKKNNKTCISPLL